MPKLKNMKSYLKSGSGSGSGSGSCSLQAETDYLTCMQDIGPLEANNGTDAERCTYYTTMVNCYPACACHHIDVQQTEDLLTNCSLPQCGDSRPLGLSTSDGWSVSEIVVASFGGFVAFFAGTMLWKRFTKKKEAANTYVRDDDDETLELLPENINF